MTRADGTRPPPVPLPVRQAFNERSAGVLNKAQYPSNIIALVVLWRLRYN
jgi:hypothetical protein